jgi:dienelactone hydrolase
MRLPWHSVAMGRHDDRGSRWALARLLWAVFVIATICDSQAVGAAEAIERLSIRGHDQTLHLYGTRGSPVAIVSSGDGGWVHLAPHVAERLAADGFFVVGVDVKSYLAGFTTRTSSLAPSDVSGDFRQLISYADAGTPGKPLLIGVSEGAGLSALAATDPSVKSAVAGVVGLGLPDINELAWRWKDSIVYLTHATPREPTFSVAAIVGRIAPVPLAAIYSSHDEFVPPAEVDRTMNAAREPKRLWTVNASDHRFSDNLAGLDRTLHDAIDWIRHTT